MTVRAVLFDLDGTLLDTLGDIADSVNAVLEGIGAPPHPESAYRKFVGDGIDELVARALPPDRQDEDTRACTLLAVRAEYGGRWHARSAPYPGVREMLEGVAARGLPSAVLSNKPLDFTQLCVDRLLPDFSFAEVVGVQADVPRKPDPTSALMIAERIGVAPADFLYLGDTNTDMQTAVAAGMTPVGALWGFRDEAELREAGAEFLIATPPELLDLL